MWVYSVGVGVDVFMLIWQSTNVFVGMQAWLWRLHFVAPCSGWTQQQMSW